MENQNNTGEPSKRSFIESLAEKIGTSAKSIRIYGEPVERNGVTVIPVSKVGYGFGGGAGIKSGEEGSGGGGGVGMSPVGYIEMKDGQTRFVPIRDPLTLVGIIAVGGMFSLLAIRSITKLLRH